MDNKQSVVEIIAQLRAISGRRHVFMQRAAARFAKGYRFGKGPVEAVVQPASLVEMWRIAEVCVAANRIIIVQAANTGLTGGSTPDGVYDRPVIIINTARIRRIHLLQQGKQVVCLAGTTLDELERVLLPLDREPHSVIGSSCIGASVIGGICNNSGGALVQRGPAYTEYALYAQVDGAGRLMLCNRLGIDLGSSDDPAVMLANLEAGKFDAANIMHEEHRCASAAAAYEPIVRNINAATPARFNADPSRLFEASGSAGKLIVFAVRLDTFESAGTSTLFYIGTNDPAELTAVRRELLQAPALPISGEYIHRHAFDLADRYGKDTVLAIRWLGTRRLPWLFRFKARIDNIANKIPFVGDGFADRLLQTASELFADHLPHRMRNFRDRFEHHLLLKVATEHCEHTRQLLQKHFPSASGELFECTQHESESALLHRFAVAGAAVRYRALYRDEVEEIVALDIALPRNTTDWLERLPPDIEAQLVHKLYYGHFLCHVFHQDYLVRKGCDPIAIEKQLLKLMDDRDAEYPAEHNVGHLYHAKAALAAHYKKLDPRNALNPGIGKTSRVKDWQ